MDKNKQVKQRQQNSGVGEEGGKKKNDTQIERWTETLTVGWGGEVAGLWANQPTKLYVCAWVCVRMQVLQVQYKKKNSF